MIYLQTIITVVYVLLILFLIFGFGKVKDFEGNADPKISFSIVVPFRNEAENLPQLFLSLKNLNYPINLYEILLVDDASEDISQEVCKKFQKENSNLNISILNNQQPKLAKKAAIETGIRASKMEFIATTDADCVVPPLWLSEFNSFIAETDAKFIAAPVQFLPGKKFLHIFQIIDFFSLQGSTIGAFGVEKPFMCNGANLCYEKAAFLEVSGFSGNEKIASGDDVFLLEKMKSEGYKCAFLKSSSAIVQTLAQPNFKKLVNQRVRWAAKASVYKNCFAKFVGWMVFLMNLALVIGLLLVILNRVSPKPFLLLFLFKFNVDFILIYRTAQFFQNEKIMKNYFLCSFLYPFFSCFIAVQALFSSYEWKGRHFKM